MKMNQYIITGNSAGRKVNITITGDDSLAKELWSFLANAMMVSKSIGAYRSVQGVMEEIDEPLPKAVIVTTNQLDDFQAGDIFTVEGESPNGKFYTVYNGTEELELLPKAACVTYTE